MAHLLHRNPSNVMSNYKKDHARIVLGPCRSFVLLKNKCATTHVGSQTIHVYSQLQTFRREKQVLLRAFPRQTFATRDVVAALGPL